MLARFWTAMSDYARDGLAAPRLWPPRAWLAGFLYALLFVVVDPD